MVKVRSGVAMLAALSLLAACGSDGGDGGGADGDASDPIKVMTIAVKSNAAFSNPQVFTAASAYVKKLNADGGINGRKVELTECDSDLDPNKETACFQRAVTDGVVAVVGSFTQFGAQGGMDLLKQAGIPYIGGSNSSDIELTSDVSFPATGGSVGWYQGQASMLLDAGATSAAMIQCETASCDLAKKLTQAYWSDKTGDDVSSVLSPLTTPEYSVQAAKVVDLGADGILVATATQAVPKVVSALAQAGYDGKIAMIDAFITDATLTAMGDRAEGILVSSLLTPLSETDDPGVQAFVAAMDDEDSASEKDALSESAWNGFDLFAQVAKSVDGDLTRESLMKGMQTTTTGITLGLSGAWSSPDAADPVVEEYPRLTTQTWSYVPGVIKDGKLVSTGPRVSLAD